MCLDTEDLESLIERSERIVFIKDLLDTGGPQDAFVLSWNDCLLEAAKTGSVPEESTSFDTESRCGWNEARRRLLQDQKYKKAFKAG